MNVTVRKTRSERERARDNVGVLALPSVWGRRVHTDTGGRGGDIYIWCWGHTSVAGHLAAQVPGTCGAAPKMKPPAVDINIFPDTLVMFSIRFLSAAGDI